MLLILTQNSRALCVDRASGLETWSILKVEQQELYLAGPELSGQKRSPAVPSTQIFSRLEQNSLIGAGLIKRKLDKRRLDQPPGTCFIGRVRLAG